MRAREENPSKVTEHASAEKSLKSVPASVASVVADLTAKTEVAALSVAAAEQSVVGAKKTKSAGNSQDVDPKTLLYVKAYSRLEALLLQDKGEANERLRALLAHIEQLKSDGEPHILLADALDKTYDRLTGKLSSDDYEKVANTMQGHSSIGMKLLGGFMLALAATMTALACVFMIPTVGASTALVAIPVACAVGAAFKFFYDSRQHGASKAMSDLDKAVKENDVVFDAANAGSGVSVASAASAAASV